MDSSVWLLSLVNTLAFLLCVGFLLYVAMILAPFLRRRDNPPGDRHQFQWHYIIPCLDEERVIGATVRSFALTFPEATLWCVDDGSTDATGRILDVLAREYDRVRVIHRVLPEAKQGKGAALNAAWSRITAEVPRDVDRSRVIVGVLDADGRLDRWCPDVICGPAAFGDARVSAVQIQVRVTGSTDELAGTGLTQALPTAVTEDPMIVRLQDLEFTCSIAAMQMLRQRTGSVGMGGNGQFTRLDALDRIALEYTTPWHGALLEDFELGLHVLLTGSRTAYCHDTFVAQAGLTRLKPLLRQRCRWAQGGMQCMRYLRQVLCSPHVSLSAALEIAYYLWVPWSQLLGSVVFPIVLGVDVYYALSAPGGADTWWSNGAWGVLPLAVIFGMGPHAMWGPIYRSRAANSITWLHAVRLGLANIAFSYVLQAAVWWALARIVRRRRDWQKTVHPGQPTRRPLPESSALPTDKRQLVGATS